MEGKVNKGHAYEEFEPFCKWQRKEDRDILEIHLQEFEKEQLKVQISSYGILKISGERSLHSRKSKFYKEVRIANNYDASAIHAKFVNGWLQITMPKIKNRVPVKDENFQIGLFGSIDRTPKPESNGHIAKNTNSVANEQIQTPGENAPTMCEFQGRNRAAKVVVTLVATTAMVTALVAYVVYMYKSTILEVDGCN